MKRRKFIQIMAASSAMMAANPFALVSLRPAIVEGGKYRITMTDGGGVDDIWLWNWWTETVPGIELIDDFESETEEADEMEQFWSPEQKKWIQDEIFKYSKLHGHEPYQQIDWDSDNWQGQLGFWTDKSWLVGDVILHDKAAFRHSIVMEMEKTIHEFKNDYNWYDESEADSMPAAPFNYPNMSEDMYEDHYPFHIRNIMIACGLINDRKLWDWFRYHPIVHTVYPSKPTKLKYKYWTHPLGTHWRKYTWDVKWGHELELFDHYWNWDHLWVNNKIWGPASIQKIG